MRKILSVMCFLALMTSLEGASVTARAVSYYVPSWLSEKPLSETITGLPVGTKIYLFYSSGTPEVLSEIDGHAVLTAYREDPAGCPSQPKETGKVRLDSVGSDHYAEAEVLSGNVREGDVVQGKAAAYLVTSAKKRCHR